MKDAIASLAVLGLVAMIVGCGSSSSGPSASSGAGGAAPSGGTGGTATSAQGGQAGDREIGGTTSGTGTGGGSAGAAGSVAGAGGNGGNAGGNTSNAGSGGNLNPYAGPGTMCFNAQCPAGQFCCEDVASDSGCITSAASCGCATPGSCIVLQCDEPADCQTGLCCATRSQSGEPIDEFSSVLCKPACGVNDYQVCTKNSDCASGECGPSSRAGLFHCF